jgi:predicted transposase YdaD
MALPIYQVLVLLRPPADGTDIESAFVYGTTRHEYQVVKMWEQDPALFLNDPALLPLTTLTATSVLLGFYSRSPNRSVQ